MTDRDYRAACANDFRVDLLDFETYDDGRFACLAMTLDDGRYIVITDRGGMAYPTSDDWRACVYTSEDEFCDDPSTSILADASSDDFADIETALHGLEFVKR